MFSFYYVHVLLHVHVTASYFTCEVRAHLQLRRTCKIFAGPLLRLDRSTFLVLRAVIERSRALKQQATNKVTLTKVRRAQLSAFHDTVIRHGWFPEVWLNPARSGLNRKTSFS